MSDYASIIKSSTAATTTSTTTTPYPSFNIPQPLILQPSGFANALSNALITTQILAASGITDFTLFSPYIHYYGTGGLQTAVPNSAWSESAPGTAIVIQPSSLLIESQVRFEAYVDKFRTAEYWTQ